MKQPQITLWTQKSQACLIHIVNQFMAYGCYTASEKYSACDFAKPHRKDIAPLSKGLPSTIILWLWYESEKTDPAFE